MFFRGVSIPDAQEKLVLGQLLEFKFTANFKGTYSLGLAAEA
jgi:hypothetical protein